MTALSGKGWAALRAGSQTTSARPISRSAWICFSLEMRNSFSMNGWRIQPMDDSEMKTPGWRRSMGTFCMAVRSGAVARL